VFVSVEDIDSLHRELTTKSYPYVKPGIETVDWGCEMQITDPFGNRIRFCELDKD
jgi:predicted enzyme related to lactoylglutathione lyase